MEARTDDHTVAQPADGAVRRPARPKTDDTARRFARNPEEIDGRLEELAQEWDIERWLQAHAGSLLLAGLGLGAFVSRKWLVVPAVVAAFLLQQSMQGWNPAVPLFRRMGLRMRDEIMRERYLLKALRGDFDALGEGREAAPHVRLRRIRKALEG
jgi:hypothetical protein